LRIVFLQRYCPFLPETLFDFFEARRIYRLNCPFEMPMVPVFVVISDNPAIIISEYQVVDIRQIVAGYNTIIFPYLLCVGSLHQDYLRRHGRREACCGQCFPDGAIAVKENLPVMVIVAKRPDGKDRSHQVEFENFHLNGRFRQNM
jgi:hypothetical protein